MLGILACLGAGSLVSPTCCACFQQFCGPDCGSVIILNAGVWECNSLDPPFEVSQIPGSEINDGLLLPPWSRGLSLGSAQSGLEVSVEGCGGFKESLRLDWVYETTGRRGVDPGSFHEGSFDGLVSTRNPIVWTKIFDSGEWEIEVQGWDFVSAASELFVVLSSPGAAPLDMGDGHISVGEFILEVPKKCLVGGSVLEPVSYSVAGKAVTLALPGTPVPMKILIRLVFGFNASLGYPVRIAVFASSPTPPPQTVSTEPPVEGGGGGGGGGLVAGIAVGGAALVVCAILLFSGTGKRKEQDEERVGLTGVDRR